MVAAEHSNLTCNEREAAGQLARTSAIGPVTQIALVCLGFVLSCARRGKRRTTGHHCGDGLACLSLDVKLRLLGLDVGFLWWLSA